MEKVYLLLRNNIELGPFTLNELLQQQLKPTDMLWVEGKSTAWTYLSEMELHLPEEPNEVDSGQKNARLVGDEIEQKAEEIRKRALSYKPGPLIIQKNIVSNFKNDPAGPMIPEDAIEIVDHRKEKNKTVNEVVITSLIIGLFAAGLYAGSHFLQSRKEIISPAAIRVTPPEKKPIPAQTGDQSNPLTTINVNQVVTDSIHSQVASFPNSKKSLVSGKKSIEDTNFNRSIPVQPIIINMDEANVLSTAKLPEPVIEKKEEPIVEEPVKKQDTKFSADKNKKPEAKNDQQAKEDDKKKGLGQTLKNIFRKKNKDSKEDKNKQDN